MGDNHRFAAGVAELEHAEDVVRELHAGCCQPLRSPRMKALSDTLGKARSALGGLDGDRDAAIEVIAFLEDAGAQLGYLQVACCSPPRTKLYTNALESLAQTQRMISRALDLDH